MDGHKKSHRYTAITVLKPGMPGRVVDCLLRRRAGAVDTACARMQSGRWLAPGLSPVEIDHSSNTCMSEDSGQRGFPIADDFLELGTKNGIMRIHINLFSCLGIFDPHPDQHQAVSFAGSHRCTATTS